jgi:hypothetical protein
VVVTSSDSLSAQLAITRLSALWTLTAILLNNRKLRFIAATAQVAWRCSPRIRCVRGGVPFTAHFNQFLDFKMRRGRNLIMCFVTAHGVNQVQFQIARRVRSLPRMPRALALSAGARPLYWAAWVGGLSMKTAAEYRAMAEECFKWASETQTDEVRVSYLQLAQVWLDAASKLDGLPPTRTRPTPDAA